MDKKQTNKPEEPTEGEQVSKVAKVKVPLDLKSCGGGLGREEEK